MITLLLTLAFINLCALLTPGPDFFFVTQTAMSCSKKAALSVVAGVTCGVLFWSFLAFLGLNIIFEKVVWLKKVLFIGGGAYLCWLGLQLLRSAFSKKKMSQGKGTQHEIIVEQEKKLSHFFFKGLATNLSNPKVIIYFGSVLSLFLSNPTLEHVHVLLLLIVILETLLWFTLVALIFSLPACKSFYQRSVKWIDGVSGGIFTIFGMFLMSNK